MGLRVRGRLKSLRPARAGDVERLVAWHADPDVARYWGGHAPDEDHTASWALMEYRC